MEQVASIEVRRCVLRVVRRGGWCWGADRRALAQSASQKLPALLANRLVARAAGAADIEIAHPVRLNVKLHQREWAALCRGTPLSADERAVLESKIDAAIVAALGLPGVGGGDVSTEPTLLSSTQGSTGVVSEGRKTTDPSSETQTTRSALLTLLAQWWADGVLEQRLCLMAEDVLSLWTERIAEASGSSRASRILVDEQVLVDLQREIDATRLFLASATTAALVHRLIFAFRVSRIFNMPASDLRRHLGERWPLKLQAAVGPYATDSSGASVAEWPPLPNEPSPTPTRRASMTLSGSALTGRSSASDFDVEVPCALPFLMLGPLARSGYLGVLAAVCEAARVADASGAFAVALARKALAPPARGWLRTESQQAAAAAFGGMRTSLPESEILTIGQGLRCQLPVLDRCIADNLVRGHRPQAAWFLAAGGGDSERLLIDGDGLTVVAHGARASLLALACPSGSPLFVGTDGTDADFDALDELQIPYATCRNLSTRRSARSFVGRDRRRSWISKHGEQQGRRRDLAARGPELIERACITWQALHNERPAVRANGDEVFERTLSLAAGFALGTLAWSLWRDRESTDPLLALERFGDFDARVRVTAKDVHVRLPLGRRFWDLRDHGLLANVYDVPWLGDRVVTFGAG